MTLLTASLYLLCLAFLLGSGLFVLSQAPRSRLHRSYALLALSLLGWVGTLFVFDTLPPGHVLLAVGRANFAAAALVATASLLFAAELAGRRPRAPSAVWLETALLAALSLWTPLVDRAETIVGGQHVTLYGALFPLYALHIVAYLYGAVATAFRAAPGAAGRTRLQLRLVAIGILATALVGVAGDIVLPYGLGDFRLVNAGALSTILFLAAVGYAVFTAHLFSLRLVVRAAFVYAGLVALALELYQLSVTALSRLIPFGDKEARGYAATAIALTVNAFTQQPVRAWLERLMDRIARRVPGRGRGVPGPGTRARRN